IHVFDNGGPNDAHAEPCIVAAEAGKHVFCEKPLARSAEEAKAMLDAVQKAGVKHMVAFNYRFVPALRQAYEIIQSGRLGRILHYRAIYLQDWLTDPNLPRTWRMNKATAGSGALGDLGSHMIDLARFLVGEPTKIQGMSRTFNTERPLPDGSGRGKVDVDDAFTALVEFENGALGTLEASRFAHGRKNHQVIEINGEKGSIRFNLERLNELEVYLAEETPAETRGYHTVLITVSSHPFVDNWWPPGHILGWEHSSVHEFHHFLDAIVNDKAVAPYGADFEDGYRDAVICDAILQSAENGKLIDIRYA